MPTLPAVIVTLLLPFEHLFDPRTWRKAQLLAMGAILSPGKRTVSSALNILGIGQHGDFAVYHHVLNRAQWSPLQLSRALLLLVAGRLGSSTEPLVFGIDETVERRWGRKIAAKGRYRDPVRSKDDQVVMTPGLQWVSLMLLTRIGWAGRYWALPFLTALVVSARYDRRKGRRHKTFTDYAQQMLVCLRRWLPDRDLVVVADGGYAKREFLRHCQNMSKPIVVVTKLRKDASLYQPAPPRRPGQIGRPRVVGARLPSPTAVLDDPATQWIPYRATGSDGSTIAEALKEAGYRTAIVGKWHLGRYGKYSPSTHGFDEFLGFRDGMIDDYFDTALEHNGQPARIGNYITDALTEAALRFVEANQTHPFFLYLSYNAPHIPNQVPEKYEREYVERGLPPHLAKVYGMITCMDDGIGRILKALKKLGLDEKTVVLFLSDNGPQMETSRQMQQFRSPEWEAMDSMWKGAARYNANLRGEKSTVYEGGIRSPFFARWPGHLPAGKTVEVAAAHIDVLPTILDLCGVPIPEGPPLDGKSLAPLLRAGRGDALHETLFFWSDAPVTQGSSPRMSIPRRNYAVRRGQWKLVAGKELYDLSRDPSEQKDLADRQPQMVKELQAAFDGWVQEVVSEEDLVRLPVPISGEDTPSIMSNMFLGGTVVDIAWASLRGEGLRYGYGKLIRDKITGWQDPNDFIRWDLDVEREGRYQVILQYGCGASDGSRIQIAAGGNRIEVAVEPTPAADVWRTQSVGFLDLRQGRSTLEIRVLSKSGKQGMDLHEVRLRWVGET